MPKILNKKLYDDVKKEADLIYKKSSAYKSGWIVKTYKSRGGEYKDDNKTKNLKRWFKERWSDISTHIMPDGTIMPGAKHNDSYPTYRPFKRINKQTPLTVYEIDPKNLKEQKIKGDKNLPKFKKKL